jgi:DNA-binding transcriptional ArsR family regulator
VDHKRLASIASVLASETRAAIVTALMDGTAHTGRELARHVGVAPSTTSEHLGVLVDAGMVVTEAQGRHRYFRLANADVAAVVEAIGEADIAIDPAPSPRPPSGLAFARSCYDHLAGTLGVRLYEAMVDKGALRTTRDHVVALTDAGHALCGELGIDLQGRASSRPTVRTCLDWTQRRHHLAGVVGAGLLTTMLDRGWLRRQPRPRELRLSEAGREAFIHHFGIEVS